MNNEIKFLNIEWRSPDPLTHFEDRFWIACLSYNVRLQYVWFPADLYTG